jgi:hypothetical protein
VVRAFPPSKCGDRGVPALPRDRADAMWWLESCVEFGMGSVLSLAAGLGPDQDGLGHR